jgi:hypothetical protein
MCNQPKPDEYLPFQEKYVTLIGDEPIVQLLEHLKDSTHTFLSAITNPDHAYAEGKWTIKEVIGHMIDAERTFAYRILAFSRGQDELPGFDENIYVEKATFSTRALQDLANEFKAVREANLYLFRSLTPQQVAATGVANGNVITVNALLYITAGHEMHHIRIIKDRYLV